MNKWMESLSLAMLAIAPSILAILSIHQYGQFGISSCALILSGIYLLIIGVVLSARCCRNRISSRQEREHLQESPIMDSPPSYEAVTSKPPPYYLLYASSTPTGAMPVTTTTTKYEFAPVHGASSGGCGSAAKSLEYQWLEDSCSDPPSYSEAVSPSSQDPSVVSHLAE